MNDRKTTTETYLHTMENANVKPDALTVLLVALFLEQNVTVVTATRDWILWPVFESDMVLGYNGGHRFYSTLEAPSDASVARAST